MAEFSASDAAFTGFRIVHERPWTVLVWAALQFTASLAMTVFVAATAGPAFAKVAKSGFELGGDPGPLIARFRELAPTYAVLLIALLVYYAVLFAAMNRAVMKPASARFAYLRLASDELRQLGLFALMAALAVGVYLVVVVAAGLVYTLLSVAGGGAGPSLALAILLPALGCALIFFGVRFSLASPMTFAEGRIDLFGSWKMTRGRFWRLLGTYLIAVVLSFVVQALTLAIGVVLVAVLGGGVAAVPGALNADMSSLTAALSPARLVYVAATAVGSALAFPITMSPPAVVYQALRGPIDGVSRVFA